MISSLIWSHVKVYTIEYNVKIIGYCCYSVNVIILLVYSEVITLSGFYCVLLQMLGSRHKLHSFLSQFHVFFNSYSRVIKFHRKHCFVLSEFQSDLSPRKGFETPIDILLPINKFPVKHWNFNSSLSYKACIFSLT